MNTFPGLVHTARQVTKVGNTQSRWPNLFGGSRLRWDWRLGLSRNKVAVPEGAAGSPPFYGEFSRMFVRRCAPRASHGAMAAGLLVWKTSLALPCRSCGGCRGGMDALLGSRIATPGFLPGAIRCPSCLGAGRVPVRWRGGAWWLENWIVDASKTRVFESLFCC